MKIFSLMLLVAATAASAVSVKSIQYPNRTTSWKELKNLKDVVISPYFIMFHTNHITHIVNIERTCYSKKEMVFKFDTHVCTFPMYNINNDEYQCDTWENVKLQSTRRYNLYTNTCIRKSMIGVCTGFLVKREIVPIPITRHVTSSSDGFNPFTKEYYPDICN